MKRQAELLNIVLQPVSRFAVTCALCNQKLLQAVVDAGACPAEPTTVIDLTDDEPRLVREGRGDARLLGLVPG